MKEFSKRFIRSLRQKTKLFWVKLLGCFLILYLLLGYLLLPDPSEYKNKNPADWSMIRSRRMDAPTNKKFNHKWVELKSISTHLVRAVVSSEDVSFFSHGGVDVDELMKVLKETVTEFKTLRGASTITQQVAKNLYLADTWSVLRKPLELIMAWRLENRLSKPRILEIYLNIIEWGDGIFGAEAAARYYFNKSAAEIGEDEAAFLAAIIPNPRTTYNPKLNPAGVKAREKIIRVKMRYFNLEANLR